MRARLLPMLCGLSLFAGARDAAAQFGQSFTAVAAPNVILQRLVLTSASGTLATSLNPFTAQIFAYDGTTRTLTGPALFTQTLGTQFSGFDLFPNLTLTPGALYAVVYGSTTPGSQPSATPVQGGSVYAGGEGLACGFGNNQCIGIAALVSGPVGTDLAGFTPTFGATALVTAVPEPGTWALMLVGLGAVAVVRRRVRV